jgi:hypothetical protein
MAETSGDTVELEAVLRQLGLIPPGYAGEVVVATSTSSGSETVTITV